MLFSLMYFAYLILIVEVIAVAVLVFPYVPISIKKLFSRLLRRFFKNKYSSYIVSVLSAQPPPVAPGLPPPPLSVDHVRMKYISQRNAYISFFTLYLLLVVWSLMKLFVTYKLNKDPNAAKSKEDPAAPATPAAPVEGEKKKDE